MKYAVVQLSKALRYKLKGREFDSWCGNCNFLLTYFFGPHCGPGVESASKKIEYQPVLRADNLTIFMCRLSEKFWGPKPPGALRAFQACNWTDLSLYDRWILILQVAPNLYSSSYFNSCVSNDGTQDLEQKNSLSSWGDTGTAVFNVWLPNTTEKLF
jgi:hypothetical protein